MREPVLPFPELPLRKKPVAQPVQPPDEAERRMALDPRRSFLVQAPAGSGKTYLLTQRFLRLLAEAERPDEIVAITFTNAAAAEMRNRVLDALGGAETAAIEDDLESLPGLARRAMERAQMLGWQLLDQPNQLRITTIDAFCRGLALQSPLSWGVLSGLGGRLDTVEEPAELYRVAAARTLGRLEGSDAALRGSIEALLLWRDNNWKDVEGQIVTMLAQRNRWHQEFVFARNKDWVSLRRLLEAPFRRDVRRKLEGLCRMLNRLPGCCDHALGLARSACEAAGKSSPLSLAERAELPVGFADALDAEVLEDAVSAYRDLAAFLLTAEGAWRKKGGLNVHHGYPATPSGRAAKERMGEFLEALAQEPGLEAALGAFQKAMPVGYTEEGWELVRHCFAVLRVAAAELQLVFAETGSVDFTEIAQIALRILAPVDGYPSDFALRQAESIRHLLIDEFQDTSRNQHQLVARLIAAWPDTEGRSCFCVGDPMQSIYGFREAEVELFERLRTHGFEMPDGPPFLLEFVQLRANFRTVPSLVEDLNGHFRRIFPEDDAADVVHFAAAEPMRPAVSDVRAELHLAFTSSARVAAGDAVDGAGPEETRKTQLDALVGLIREKLAMADAAKVQACGKYRIAVLGRTRGSLVRIAEALRVAKIGFRAIDLVKLGERPEVLDALALARALMNPVDRTAWLGVLRAPWCGLSLEELHWLTSADDVEMLATPVPVLLGSRLGQLHRDGRIEPRAFKAAERVGRVLAGAADGRPDAAGSALGTWVESVWKVLGGEATVDAEQRQNLVRLWAALDALPQGEVDLVGAGLGAALDRLFALPDPAASSDFGVQLMTIHKSKGLEFEVVIVPDLEEKGREGEQTMISWLERGLTGSEEDDGDQLTEFLIAPFQAKGTEAGAAKRWVDEVKRARERQELRRVLYVAATRAREELHFFARPQFSVSKAAGGATTLCSPRGLLATAWPALGEAVEVRFIAWQTERVAAPAEETELETLAAEGGRVLPMPSRSALVRTTWVRRLPEDFVAPGLGGRRGSAGVGPSGTDGQGSSPLYARTEGGLRSRLEGTAIHAFLEHLARLRMQMSTEEAAVAMEDEMPGIVAEIRSHGLSLAAAQRLVQEALVVARRTLTDVVGAWMLTPYPDAAAEARWTGLVRAGEVDSLRTLRPDRVFLAAAPEELGLSAAPVWWIIDYKTSHADAKDGAQQGFLESHRLQHIDQLAAYAQMLRGLRGNDPVLEAVGDAMEIRAGIYYPRLQLFDHWLA